MARPVDPEKAQMILNDPIDKVIWKMSVPTIIAQLITVIYNMTDTFFVSQLGTNATAAVGVNSTLENTINMVGMLIGIGAASYISRLLGAKKKEYADQVFSTSFFCSIAIGVVFAIFGMMFIEPLVNLLGADASCRMYSIEYGTYVLMAAPFMVVSYMLNQCLRSEGSPTRAMIGIGFGGILNCFLDPLFIFGLGLGVKGASIATAISKIVSCGILFYPYLRKRSIVALSIHNIKFRKNDAVEIVTIGATSFIRQFTSVLASALMNRAASGVSTAMLAAISVSNRVMLVPFNIILGFGQGYMPVAGYNWGAKRYDRSRQGLSFATKVSIIGGVVMGAISFAFAKQIIGAFNSQADMEVMRIGILCIRLQAVALPLHAFLSTINMCYGGIGKAKQSLVLSLARQGYCFWVMIFLLPLLFGEMGLVAVQAGADFLSIVVALPMGIAAFRMMKKCELESMAKEAVS